MIENYNNLDGYDYPYIALDGSEHMEMADVLQASEEFWNSILKDDDIKRNELLIAPYKKVLEILWYLKVDYETWNGLYQICEKGFANNLYSDAFERVFLQALIDAKVICLTYPEEYEYLQKRVLITIIDELFSPGRK